MGKKQSVRGCVAGLIVACALASMSTMTAQADTVTTTINVGSGALELAINPAGTFAYVANNGSNSVSKIDLATDTVTSTINVGVRPISVAINPAGTFAYVANFTGSSGSGSVTKIDLATDTVSNTISVRSGPIDVVINPAGTYAYVTDYNGGISKINLASDTVTITAITRPFNDLAINPSGTFAYGTLENSGTVSKIDLATDTVTSTIKVGTIALGVAINPAGTFAYVTSYPWTLSKIDLATDTVTSTINLPKGDTGAYAVVINPAGSFAYVRNHSLGVYKINLATETLTSTIKVDKEILSLSINPAGTFVYLSHFNHNSVSKIAVTATDPQSISFSKISTQLSGTKTMALSATASSPLPVTFSSTSPTVCTVLGSTVTLASIGDCTINANQAGGSGWDAAPQVTQTFSILPSPQTGEIGMSINSGEIFTNTRSVKLDLVWPEFATGALISNDGGFLASKTSTIQLAASVDWTLESSGSERLPKTVYVRFVKSTGNTTTFTDDIILDMTPPALTSATAVASSTTAGSVSVLPVGAKSKSGIKLLVKASDANSGIGWIEVRTSSKSAATKIRYVKPKNKSQTFNLKTTSKSIQVRVLDLAGNTSKWKTVKTR